MQLSQTEENYIKAIYALSERSPSFDTSTNEIAVRINTKPPSVSDMLRKLTVKKLVTYQKYKRVTLTKTGRQVAIQIIRKHRLWEVFLHDKLQFTWDEVHEVAEQLEHIQSEKLTERLEKYLGYPKYDPHGDPIPSATGELKEAKRLMLSEMEMGVTCQVVGVKDSSSEFLQYLHQIDVGIGTKIKVLEQIAFDHSLIVSFKKGHQTTVSKKFADNVLVTS
ncbi:metal-dependent transcriptional regulator [Flavihumibacter petaseus]|uniref:Transcriptional regulator MntR n=1 Tax=Flavihumibacter petaseus NBRC 106054 TaxID=1220578 RepID=A0A0E9MYI7_9BACT|nr:metal-dependent transcriptional regulator [Flavihumibacter petaseus]GAO42654.1 putative DtxR family transcriptional regulator [Flavihumibacter petaseus NBRC 106054]